MSQYNKKNPGRTSFAQDYTEVIKDCVENFPVEGKAEELARAFVREKISSAQLRRFYNDFKSLERTYDVKTSNDISKEDAFNVLRPSIKIAKAKVSYAKARKTVPLAFEDWLKQAVDKINSHDGFEKFLLHFEAIVGYAYGAGLKDNS